MKEKKEPADSLHIKPFEVRPMVRQMINVHYPELRHQRILVIFVKGRSYYMAVRWDGKRYRLFIDRSAFRFSKEAFIGCLAHELAHMAIILQCRRRPRIWKVFFYKNITAQERAADWMTVVIKGFGWQLLALHREHNCNYIPYSSADGLTTNEIEALLHDGGLPDGR